MYTNDIEVLKHFVTQILDTQILKNLSEYLAIFAQKIMRENLI